MSKRNLSADAEDDNEFSMEGLADGPPRKRTRLAKASERKEEEEEEGSSSGDGESYDSMADFIASSDESDLFDDAEMEALARALNQPSYMRGMHQTKESLKQERYARKGKGSTSKDEWQHRVQQAAEERRRKMLDRAKRDPKLAERIKASEVTCIERYGKGNHHPLGLISDLFFHQISAVAWLLLREQLPYKGASGSMLSDDMGLGKTLDILTLMAFSNINGHRKGKSSDFVARTQVRLVVAPNTLLLNWVKEARMHFEPHMMQLIVCHDTYTPDWRSTLSAEAMAEANGIIINYEGLRSARKALVNELASDMIQNPERYVEMIEDLGLNDADVPDDCTASNLSLTRATAESYADKHLEIGYRTIWSNPKYWSAVQFLYGWQWQGVVLDESGNAKNGATYNFQSIMDLKYDSLITLSGTPMENSMDELYNMLRLLGVDKGARSIANKKKWNQLVKAPEDGRPIAVPSDETVNKLRRRFLNVLQLRREIQNVNGINPLAPYVERMQPEAARVYENYINVRSGQKQLRSFNRRNPSRAVDEETEPDHWEATLDRLVYKEMGEEAHEEVLEFVSDGFYWYTSQTEFEQAFKRVNAWIHEAFGITLRDINNAHEAVRSKMRSLGIRVPVESEHCKAVVTSVEEVLAAAADVARSHEEMPRHHGRPFKVLTGLPVPKPHLFVSYPHALEKAVYSNAVQQTSSVINTTKDKPSQTASAFDCLTRVRASCADYRTGAGAVEFLDSQRTLLWDTQGEVREPSTVPLHVIASDKKAATEKRKQKRQRKRAKKAKQKESIDPEDFLESSSSSEDEQAAATIRTRRLPMRSPTKYLMLLRYIRAAPRDDKMIIFSDMIQCFPYLSQFLTAHGISNIVITGANNSSERITDIARFNDTKSPNAPQILIASLKLFNAGHNFQVANHVIILLPWWTGGVEEQAKRRILRFGQKKLVHFAYFVMLGSVEELVLARSGLKTEMIDRVIGFDDGVIKTGANYSRPMPEDAMLMEFEQDQWGGWLPTSEAQQEKSIEELLKLPKEGLVGKSFNGVADADILSADGKIKPVNIARVLASRDRTTPNQFVFHGLHNDTIS